MKKVTVRGNEIVLIRGQGGGGRAVWAPIEVPMSEMSP